MAQHPTTNFVNSGAPASTFASGSAARLLVIGGMALIITGLIFGDLFAVFVLHQNAGRIGESLLAATRAAAAGDSAAVSRHFSNIGRLLENRGTKVDTHVHVIDFGYLALLLALVQPYVALSEQWRRRLARVFLVGATTLPAGVFAIYYVGQAYSPLQSIGWGSIVADFGGLLVIVACAGALAGLWKYARGPRVAAEHELLKDRSWSGRVLLAGGTLLILAGFLHGLYYAARDLERLHASEAVILKTIVQEAAAYNLPAAEARVNDYGMLQAEKAVKIAAHSHIIEFGLLAMMLAFIQPYVYLGERWRRRWVIVYLAGSVMLPVAVFLELHFGLLAGGVADFGGLLVILAMFGMLAGVLRHTGRIDAAQGAAA